MTIAETRGSGAATAGDYLSLLKPRVMSLVVFTALVAMVVAPGEAHLGLAGIALFALAVGAGASGALNMWFDADIDRLMKRTAGRAVPSGRVAPVEAAALGVTLSILSVVLMALAANYLAAGLLAFTIFFYAVIYTMILKRRTAQNIVIGGAAGAFPPVIGWAAVTGEAPLAAWMLFLVIFVWTPPHFWALALCQQADYGRAGIPMMPNVAGERSTRLQIVAYSLLLALVALSLPVAGLGGMLYLTVAAAGSAAFVAGALRLLMAPQAALHKRAMELFWVSIIFLFALFAALLVESLLGLAPLIERAS